MMPWRAVLTELIAAAAEAGSIARRQAALCGHLGPFWLWWREGAGDAWGDITIARERPGEGWHRGPKVPTYLPTPGLPDWLRGQVGHLPILPKTGA